MAEMKVHGPKIKLFPSSQIVNSEVAKALNLPSTSLSEVLYNGCKYTCKGCDDLSTLMDEVK
jgi:hypothetical protein